MCCSSLLLQRQLRILAAFAAFAWPLAPSVAVAQVQICVIGDSNVYGQGVPTSQNYPSKLERSLRAEGYDVRVKNSGVNGDTTNGVLNRLDAAAPLGTQVAVLWIGINDRRQGASWEDIAAKRAVIARRLRARGIQVLVIDSEQFDELHKNPQTSFSDTHLKPAGYDRMVASTLLQVEKLVQGANRNRKKLVAQ